MTRVNVMVTQLRERAISLTVGEGVRKAGQETKLSGFHWREVFA